MGWSIYKYNTGTLTFDLDGTIPRPNSDLLLEINGTQQKVQMADGSYTYFAPENKYQKENLTFAWVEQDQDFKDKIEEYITNYDYLKIETHISGTLYTFIGRFISWKPTWLVGVEPDRWDIEATFQLED